MTGYYSLRYGVGGTEAAFNQILRGVAGRTEPETWLAELLHRPQVGQDVTLTIDLPAQVAADVALGEQEGAVVVMDLATGAILVMSSHPTYDPNTLDQMWDGLRQDEQAPLLNRATQGLFPVGDLARLIGLVGLYESGLTVPAEPLAAPLEEMLSPLGETGYLATAHQLGLTRPLAGLPSQPGRLPNFAAHETVKELAVTPLHLARVIAALELGGLDRLVTNSGGVPSGAFETFDDTTWQKAIDLVLMSHVRLIRTALPYLRKSSAASVLTITSYAVKQPIPNLVLSNSIRLATIGLTKSLALELGVDGIRFNSILPAWTFTERVQELMEARARFNSTTVQEEIEKQSRESPLGRMGEPQEFANAAVFLLSPAASYITGVMLSVDGGMYKGTF